MADGSDWTESFGRAEEINRRLRQYRAQLSAVRKSTTNLATATSKLNEEFKKSITSTNGVIGQLRNIATSMGSVYAIFLITQRVMKILFAGFIKQERAETILNSTLLATGEAAGYTVEQLKALAKEYQKITTFSDEDILESMAMLSSFVNITGGEFKTATMAAMDLSVVMKTSLKEATIQLAKALNDPIKTLSALRRSGVSFTEEEAEMIKAMWNVGRQAEAQTRLLILLKEQGIDNVATALRDTFGGAVQSANNQFGDLMEEVGESLVLLLALRDSVEDAAVSMSSWETILNKLHPLFNAIGRTIAFMNEVGKTLFKTTTFLNLSLGITVELIIALTLSINDFKAAWSNWSKPWNRMRGAGKELKKDFKSMVDAVKDLFSQEKKNNSEANKNLDINKKINDVLKARYSIFSGFDKINQEFQKALFKDAENTASSLPGEINTFTDALKQNTGGRKIIPGEPKTSASANGEVITSLKVGNEKDDRKITLLEAIRNEISANKLIFTT